MKKSNISCCLLLLSFLICCTPESGKGQKINAANAPSVTKATAVAKSAYAVNDEKEFRALLKTLSDHLKKKDISGAAALMNFPFYTSHAELNGGMGTASDAIAKSDFDTYKKSIFNGDVLRLLPKLKEDNLSEIDEKTGEVYYQSLKKITDPGSKMYEAYMQYPEINSQAESFFGFVFGKVNGKYKTIATYAKWPVK